MRPGHSGRSHAEIKGCYTIGRYTTGDTLTSTLTEHLHTLPMLDEKLSFLSCPSYSYSMELGYHFPRISVSVPLSLAEIADFLPGYLSRSHQQ